jgi:hypothetical protein
MAMLSEGIWIIRRILGLRHYRIGEDDCSCGPIEEKPRLMNIPQTRGVAENTTASANV